MTAYEVLTGRKPVSGNTLSEVYKAYMNMEKEVRLPREFNKEIPPSVQRTVLKCLAKDADHRYPVMSLVLRDLHASE